MKKTPFIWLGAGRAKKRGVARRGRQLDEAARAGLPVPEGAILLDELFHLLLQEGVIEQMGGKVIVPDPIWLLEVFYRDVRFPRLRKTVDIGVIPGDDLEGSSAPQVIAHAVDLEDASQLATALSKVWSFPAANEEFRHDVTIVTRIQGQTTGRALSSPGGVEDVVTIFSGIEKEEIHLPRLGRWNRPSGEFAPQIRRLQMLLRGVRRTLGDEDAIDFHWRDDGQVCWIVLFN